MASAVSAPVRVVRPYSLSCARALLSGGHPNSRPGESCSSSPRWLKSLAIPTIGRSTAALRSRNCLVKRDDFVASPRLYREEAA